ncbi:MAG: homoserine kinase [Gemmatimonadales bacterium]
MPSKVRVYAPGSVGNVGPGFDVLGLAFAGAGDVVTAEAAETPGVEIVEAGHPLLSRIPEKHTGGIAAMEVIQAVEREDFGVRIWVEKGLPLSGGQGGSAASAVASAVAVNLLLGSPLDRAGLMLAALSAEAAVSGLHPDNVAPILLGGLVLVRSLEPLDWVQLPVHPALRIVLAQPEGSLDTREGRDVLPSRVPLGDVINQLAQVGALVAATFTGDLRLLGRSIDDRIAEPPRARLLPGFPEAKRAAMAAGALGCSISGSGPTAFALVDSDAAGQQVARAMVAAYEKKVVRCTARVTTVDLEGARPI